MIICFYSVWQRSTAGGPKCCKFQKTMRKESINSCGPQPEVSNVFTGANEWMHWVHKHGMRRQRDSHSLVWNNGLECKTRNCWRPPQYIHHRGSPHIPPASVPCRAHHQTDSAGRPPAWLPYAWRKVYRALWSLSHTASASQGWSMPAPGTLLHPGGRI